MTGFNDFKRGDLILVRHNTAVPWRLAIFHNWTSGHSLVEAYLYDFDNSFHRYKLWRPLPTLVRRNEGKWMVSADGRRAPSFIHNTLTEACAEAKRLIEEKGVHRTRVLLLERTYVCKRIAAIEDDNA